jgi:hypothetical protein
MFCPTVGSITPRTKRRNTRWVVRGSRLFKKICGHPPAKKK